MNKREKRSQPALLVDFSLETHQGQRMCVLVDYRLKNLLFMLEVVYSERAELVEMSSEALQQITDELEALNQSLLTFITEMPQPRSTKAAIKYNSPHDYSIHCTTPQALTYVEILKNFDLLVQQCDRLWLTRQWTRKQSRQPLRQWAGTIAKTLSQCVDHFSPLRRQYIENQKFQQNTNAARSNPPDVKGEKNE